MDRHQYATMTDEALKSRFLAALDRSERANTVEAYLADEFAMQEIWVVLEERGQPHPFIKSISVAA